MTQRPQVRRGLGRGLGSLIPTAPPPEQRVSPDAGHESEPPHQDPDAVNEPGSIAVDVLESPAPDGSDESDRPTSNSDHGFDQRGVDSAGDPGQPGVRSADGSDRSETDAGVLGPSERIGPQGLDHPGLGGAYFAELPVSKISPNPRQPRQVFDEDALAELVQSIREVGLLQPVVVRQAGEDRYELVMGERRWRATQQAGLDTIPAIVRHTGDDDLLRDALLENLHRAELNPLEEAAAYQQLLDDFGCTHDELASRIGRSRPQISNTLRLLKLTPAVQRRVAAGVLSAGHARALLGVDDAEAQDRLAGRVVAEGISVRGLEEIVAVGDVGPGRSAGTRRSKPTSPGLEDLAAHLSDRLETRVKVDLGRRKGRITVEFASLPDLERIIGVIDPGYEGRSHHESTD